MIPVLLEQAAKTGLLLLAGTLAARLLASRSAAVRHQLWTTVVAAALAVAPLSLLLPDYPVVLLPHGNGAGGRIAATLPRARPEGAPAGVRRAPRATGPGLPVTARAAHRPATLPAPRTVLAVWAAVALALLGRMAAGQAAILLLRRRSRPVADPRACRLALEAAREVGLRRPVSLLAHAGVSTPVTFGTLRPTVVLPAESSAWPAERLRAVLLHEISHVKRLDCLKQTAAELLCALHWYDPLAWYASRRMLAERERACDDEVLRRGIAPAAYAGHLLDTAREVLRGRSAVPAAAVAMARTAELEVRLRAILAPATPRGGPSRAYRAALAAAAVAGAALLGAVRTEAVGAAPRAGGAEAVLPAPALPDSLDDPLSERLPVDDPRSRWPGEEEVRAAPDRPAILRLLEAAAHAKQWQGDLVRERAGWALAQVRDGEVVVPLVGLLGSSDWRVLAYAAWALAVAGDRRAAAPLARLLDHPVWRVRAQAVASLLELGAPLAPGSVDRLAGDPAWQVRIGVVEHLRRAGGPDALRRLASMRGDPHGATRGAVEEAVAELSSGT